MPVRSPLFAGALISVACALLIFLSPTGADELVAILQGRDSLAYHVAGRMFLEGASPFDAIALRQWQLMHGYPETAATLYFHYLPAALLFLAPMSLLSYQDALLFWFLASIGILLWAGCWYARTFSVAALPAVAVGVLSLLFLPHLDLLFEGQVAALFALAIAGISSALKEGKPFRAGYWLAPLLLKPHLFMVLFGFLALRSARNRSLTAGLGLLLPILLGSVIVEWWIPGIHRAWLESFTSLPPYPPTAALLSFVDSWWLSVSISITLAIVLSLFIERWVPRGAEYRSVPLLLVLSILLAPRVWVSDLSVLILLPVAAAVVLCEVRSQRESLLIFGALALSQVALIIFAVVWELRDARDFCWFPLVMLPLALVPIRSGDTLSDGRSTRNGASFSGEERVPMGSASNKKSRG